MSERETGGMEVPMGTLEGLVSSTGLINGTASLTDLVLGNGRDSDFYRIQIESRHRAIKAAIGLEAFTSFFEYIADHPVSSIPDFAAALSRWRNKHPELEHRIPKYNKSKWERNLSIFTKKDIESVFGIHFTPRVRKPLVRKNEGVVSAEYLEKNGLIDLNTLEKKIGTTMSGYVLLFVSGRENQFQYTVTEKEGKKTVAIVSASGHEISFDELVSCVQGVKITSFSHDDTRRLVVEREDTDFLLEIDFDKVLSGWNKEMDTIFSKFRRKSDGFSQGKLKLE